MASDSALLGFQQLHAHTHIRIRNVNQSLSCCQGTSGIPLGEKGHSKKKLNHFQLKPPPPFFFMKLKLPPGCDSTHRYGFITPPTIFMTTSPVGIMAQLALSRGGDRRWLLKQQVAKWYRSHFQSPIPQSSQTRNLPCCDFKTVLIAC